MIAEKYVHEDILELNFLYVPAYRFNKTWSAIGLFGVMLESGADSPDKSYTILLNASVFANLNERLGPRIGNQQLRPYLSKNRRQRNGIATLTTAAL